MREQHPELTVAHALHHQRAGERFRGAAGACGLPGRQFVGRHQGVLVPRHAGRQHRQSPAGPADRRARHARAVTTPRRSAPRLRRSSRTAATSRRTSTTATTPATTIADCSRRRRSTRRSDFSIPFESPRHHHGPRRIQGHSRQEPQAAGRQAAACLHGRQPRGAPARSIA